MATVFISLTTAYLGMDSCKNLQSLIRIRQIRSEPTTPTEIPLDATD